MLAASDEIEPSMGGKQMLRINKHIVIEGSIGGLLILLSLPAIARALGCFDYRTLAGLFLFLIAFVLVRDPRLRTRFSDLINKRSRNNGN